MQKLRFDKHNLPWTEKKLEEIANITMGQSPNSSDYTNDLSKGLPLIQGNGDMKNGRILAKTNSTSGNKKSYPNDIIMTVRAPVGVTSVNNKESYIGRGVCAISGNSYIYQFLQLLEQKSYWAKESQGTTFKAVNSDNIKNLSVPLPSLPEQEKIGGFLSALDAEIEAQSELVDLVALEYKGYSQRIFSQQLRFKDENGEDYPEWEEKKLGEVADCLDNQRKPLNSEERKKSRGDIPYYGAVSVVDYVGDYIFDEPIILLGEDGVDFKNYRDKPIAQLVKGKSWVNNHAHIFRVNEKNMVNLDFLFQKLISTDLTKQITGGTRTKLTKSEAMKIVIPLPSLPEQEKIGGFLSSLSERIESEKELLDQLKERKKAYLQKLFP